MPNNFKNKRILFIGPIFHNYHTLIKEKMEFLGASVDFYPERDYGLKFKVINNFFKKHVYKLQNNHYESILQNSKNEDYDYLFVIRGYMLPDNFINKFLQSNSKAKTIMYQWDSNQTNPFSTVAGLFDQVYSFDFKDCQDIPFLKYLPLFYTDDLIPYMEKKSVVVHDFFFMGWCFPERYKAVVSFREFAITNNYKLKAFLYMPFSSYLKEILKGNFLDRSIVSFTPMNRTEYLSILSKSKVMVDVSNPRQTGLAMRVIESLAIDVKVLTNNLNLKQDELIKNSESICFFSENNVYIDNKFIRDMPSKSTSRLMLSMEDWLKQIFFDQHDEA
ncbi:Lipopolysaccharide biosynthesis protein [Flavobacterium sp. 9R]|uniref:hypothetical protein n=1 Tax=Flavobacterium sp. 9R TaxID=2653143 RepID=UPI0012F2355F|nr:hypothetical protein [Flavobacterium sp. 9R]VXA96199.1 Lipopolysaccharide biosynthesis protein [Flavobacterium sp. 9R]